MAFIDSQTDFLSCNRKGDKSMSHTVKVKVEFKDTGALARAVELMGGAVIGQGQHELYSGSEPGWGFTLPGWQYPLILRADGSLAFDDYHGYWGNVADLDRLKAEYALGAAEVAAQAQGWYCERVSGELMIYHPDGGVLRVNAEGTVDASQFTGPNCVLAAAPIEQALGTAGGHELKPEFYQVKQSLTLKGE